ncbi:hypothetical protein [Actinomycetospora sp.]|uniref:hypothetical protein n=1 Tax=Actinomycetospora sp. TaxID=1872135 RepID=UPI002F42A768
MKLLLTGTPVSPSRVTDVCAPYGVAAASGPRCWAPSHEGVPFAGLGRTRAFAATPITAVLAGDVSPQVGSRPVGMSPRKRQQHIDLDPQRPRPSGGCG